MCDSFCCELRDRQTDWYVFLGDMPSVLAALFGVMASDLFTYFAHLLMHKSWLGWQFHRVLTVMLK